MVTRGRPRSFDRDKALRAAMQCFWKLGYESASMADLTEAMGINSPSLYACFGSKEELFRAAVQFYLDNEDCENRDLVAEAPTAREAIRAMLRHSAYKMARSGHPSGCLLILGDSNATPENASVRTFLAERRSDLRARIERRLKQGIADGDIPTRTDIKAMATFYMTVLQGLSLQARDGASREAMTAIADSALVAWDSLLKFRTTKSSRGKAVA
jgi:AcrR family transcriptional regulator